MEDQRIVSFGIDRFTSMFSRIFAFFVLLLVFFFGFYLYLYFDALARLSPPISVPPVLAREYSYVCTRRAPRVPNLRLSTHTEYESVGGSAPHFSRSHTTSFSRRWSHEKAEQQSNSPSCASSFISARARPVRHRHEEEDAEGRQRVVCTPLHTYALYFTISLTRNLTST